ncbi:MAG TPA: HPr family phosphocarrier protein [Syntrophales bacterium]|nr:HPr family phosphocarrier protein [Syntrophales bacterium]HOL59983.1 HPr family phosphocarrier protein [Syntrophales bacterium]HPO36104.1 HPr family phosphocarrier protein [Syntrophales bacterium]
MSTIDMTYAKTVQVINSLGLHARAAAKIVKLASDFVSEITLEMDGNEVNAKSILGILTLACPMGTMITIAAQGPDARQAVEALEALFKAKFHEE